VIHEDPDEDAEGNEEAAAAATTAAAVGPGVSLKELGGRHPRLVFYDLSASGMYAANGVGGGKGWGMFEV
jgi:hypothetical protein